MWACIENDKEHNLMKSTLWFAHIFTLQLSSLESSTVIKHLSYKWSEKQTRKFEFWHKKALERVGSGVTSYARVLPLLSRADIKKFHSGMRILEYTRIKATYRISLKENFLLSNCKSLLRLDHLLQSEDC